MGLRGRLALFFVAITVVPLTVAVVALRVQIDSQLESRAAAELQSVRDAAVSLVATRRERAGDLATDLALRDVGPVLAGPAPAAEAWLRERTTAGFEERADFVVLVAPGGTPLASRADAHGVDAAAVAGAARAQTTVPGLLLEVREVRGAGTEAGERLLGWVVTGIRLDEALLERLVVGDGLAFTAGGRILASLDADARTIPAETVPDGAVVELPVGQRPMLVTAAALESAFGMSDGDGGGTEAARLIVWASPTGESPASGIALLVLAASTLAAAMLGFLLAAAIAAPIRRAAGVARAVAGGDLSQSLEPTGGRELEDLAIALNTMSAELAARLEDLERSRDQLRQSLSRLGQALSSSLDLNRTLAVVVETALDTFAAERGALLLFTPERDALYVKVGRNVGEDPIRIGAEEGVAGHVARTGRPVRLPADAAEVPPPVPGEVAGAQQLSVPLTVRARVMGVLSLIRDEAERPFSADDVDAVQTFASQASGAIENVMLHQEARRLSVTDPLTGLWNFRYFQLQVERELEGSERFDRPVSLLIADLDHFKQVNDVHGHQVGDEVLIEVAARMRDATRVPDVVARYGGEEFVVLLPGTDEQGAFATAERIRVAVAGVPVATSKQVDGAPLELEVTCSVGVATFPRDGRTLAALLRSADAAMYVAKRDGRDRVVVAGGKAAATDRRRSPAKRR